MAGENTAEKESNSGKFKNARALIRKVGEENPLDITKQGKRLSAQLG